MISCGVKLSPIKHITTDFETEIQADYISLKIVIPCVVLLFYEDSCSIKHASRLRNIKHVQFRINQGKKN